MDVAPEKIMRWLAKLKQRDPKLHQKISKRIAEETAPTLEMALEGGVRRPSPQAPRFALETIVMETGRPAIPVRGNEVSYEDAHIDAESADIVSALKASAGKIEPLLALVGRIDVANFPGSADYVGTGWQIDPGVVVTNRHVAELVARRDGARFVFRPGRFGEPLAVSMDYRHELGSEAVDVAEVTEVLWIEEDPNAADIAFVKIAGRDDGSHQNRIELADDDAAPGDQVAVIGYPARAPRSVIEDQDLMDRIYGRTYDIKRIAPGLADDDSRGWATHDCTTLGGNSGSVVVEVASGKAVALHFAGLYLIENYAVPVSTIRRYVRERPWEGRGSGKEAPQPGGASPQPAITPHSPALSAGSSASVTIPVTVSVSIGDAPGDQAQIAIQLGDAGSSGPSAEAAARELGRQKTGNGILAVRSGFVVKGGLLSDDECITVWAHPEALEAAARHVGSLEFAGYPVTVEAASIDDQISPLGVGDGLLEAVSSVSYNDRTGKGFSFDEVHETMEVTCHVGPERSWEVLSAFLSGAKKELITSIYEFHAKHIADTVAGELDGNVRMTMVMDRKSRDPRSNEIRDGDFDRSETFDAWGRKYGDRFERIFVPTGGRGLVATSYHIKVTVRDRDTFWLSSGNWKRTSQPLISAADRDDPRAVSRQGNREWHVVIKNKTLAGRFRNHIIADFKRSQELGGTLEAPFESEFYVDVPISAVEHEAVELEAASPGKVFEPLDVKGKVRVKPLLTPDGQGEVFSEAVLDLIRSATNQLVFQNQYINMKGANAGYLKALVDELVAKSNEVSDFRLLLRSGMSGLKENLIELKKRGMDVNRKVKVVSHSHTKGIVVDGERVLIGSHNWSWAGVSLNRDASLIVHNSDIANYFLEAFEIDWARARKPVVPERITAEAPRIAVGDAPPPGFRRMSLEEFIDD